MDWPNHREVLFHAYFFGDAVSEALPSKDTFHDIAYLVETWLSGYEKLRCDCALAYLSSKMESSTFEWQRKNWRLLAYDTKWSMLVGLQLNVLKDVLEVVLDADGCTVFLPNQQRDQLMMATSTGVVFNELFDSQFLVKTADNSVPVEYPLGTADDKDNGILSYLYHHPAVRSVRVNSLLAFESGEERVTPEDLPRVVVRRFMEPLCEDTEDRRFLAGTMSEDGTTTAVMRLVRSVRKPPFTEDDAVLLEQLLRLCGERKLWCDDRLVNRDLGKEGDELIGAGPKAV